MTANNYLIYKHTSPSGKAYIGQTKNYAKRCSAHKNNSNCTAFAAAINKYGWDNFIHEILHKNLSLQQANELEELCILEHNTLSPNGYNLKTGGLNNLFSNETKVKMSLAWKSRKPVTEETKAKLRESHKNISQETRDKLSLAGTGRKHTEETKIKMSIAAKNIPKDIIAKRSAKLKGRPLSEKMRLILLQSATGRIVSEETKTKMSIVRFTAGFNKLQIKYQAINFTDEIYSSKKLSKLLSCSKDTIKLHFSNIPRNEKGHMKIPVLNIHTYFNQLNPYES
jgi:group I intron endonuclease